jgi:tetratricopeptide (TPR) repeat protein
MAKAGLQGARRAGFALFDLLDRPGGDARVSELAFNRELPMIFVRNFALEKQLVDDGLAILREFAGRPAGGGTVWVRPRALNHLGLLFANCGRYGEALASYDEALRLTTRFDELHFNRAMTCLRLHRWEEAKREFGEYAKRFPRSPVPTFGTALLAETKGDLREAERLYRFFLDRVSLAPVAPAELALLDIARTWVDHAKTWLDAASRPRDGGSFERDDVPGAEGDVSDRPRGTE